MTNVLENSQNLDVEEPKEKSFKSTSITEDLTKLKGIGPSTALKLNGANIKTFKQLADVSPSKLSVISGVNINTAQKFISEAKTHLPEYIFETFDVAEIFIKEKLIKEEFEGEANTIETTQEQWFEDKFNYSRLTQCFPPITENSSENSSTETEEVQDQPQEQTEDIFNEEFYAVKETPSEKEVSREEPSFVPEVGEIIESEDIPELFKTQNELEEIENRVEESLKIAGYYVIPASISALNQFMEIIDYIACKFVRVSKWVNHIFLVPIKICDLEGTVLVDEAKLDYDTKTIDSRIESMSRLRHYYNNLLSTRDLAFDDIINGKRFREFFQKYLQVNLILEKSVENKKLFFISGQTQYKVLIEPIMLCKTPPRCMEKSLSFPYQRSTNIHVIHQPDLSLLLEFLEQKYRLIESRVTSSNTIKDYQKVDDKFRTNVRIASIPLVGYAIALSIIYFAGYFFLLRLFNSIGFAIVGIYISILAYLYLKFYKAKKVLSIEFKTPYYMQNLEFSETDLLEFKDQFTSEEMAQFGYECFGKDNNFKVLEQIEKASFVNSVDAKKIEHVSTVISESEEEMDEDVSVDNSEYSNKYLSFLDD